MIRLLKQNRLKYTKYITLLLMVLSMPFISYGQTDEGPVIDKIIAKVDNYIILLSDVEFAYLDLASRGALVGEEPKCNVLQSLIGQKLLLAIAEIDSVIVPEAQVDSELANRMQYFINQSGGDIKALEEYYGKTLEEIQAEMRDDMKEQMIAQRMRSVISEEVTITPSEVRKFFNRIHKDSLPYFSEEVEVAQIVKIAKIGKEQKLKVETQLNDIKASIESGAHFDTMAEMYSMDPGSAKKGGELPGWYKRGQLAPEYEAAIFKLKTGEISSPVETDFGFHLIQVIERRGNEFRTRHILITPNSSDLDIEYTIDQLDSIRDLVVAGGQDFEKLAKDFSDDKMSAPSGGFFLNNSGATSIAVDQLEPTVYFMLDTMKVGNVTKPIQFRMPSGKEAVRIMFYKSKTAPHQANLKQDWQKIQEAALNEKKTKAEAKWVKDSKEKVYIYIEEDFEHCDIIQR
jgi:peptidyl-prolyl cis-trans isomerase SurA